MVRESFAFLTGLFVLVLGTAAAMSVFFLGDYGQEHEHYVISTKRAVSGLNPEAEVIFRGVKAGKVKSIRFDPKDTRNILVLIELNKGLPITLGTYATLRVQALTGLAEVELNDKGDRPTPLDTSAQNVAQIPLEPSFLDKIEGSGGDILTQLIELTQRLNEVLGDRNQNHVEHGLMMLDKVATDLVVLEQQLGNVLDRVPSIDKQIHTALKDHSAAAHSVQDTSERIGQLTKDVAEILAQTKIATASLTKQQLPELRDLVRDLHETTLNLKRLSSSLERDPQMLLLGPKHSQPGPGESGFKEPK